MNARDGEWVSYRRVFLSRRIFLRKVPEKSYETYPRQCHFRALLLTVPAEYAGNT
jgi:hypothetical protein